MWQAERHDDFRKDVGVGVRVGVVECQLFQPYRAVPTVKVSYSIDLINTHVGRLPRPILLRSRFIRQ